jgi:uncharacterized protein (TIGR02246 family)
MSRTTKFLALVVALAATSSTQAQVKQQGGTGAAAAKAAVEATWAAATAATKKGDVAGLLALYTPDAIVLDPAASTVRGRAAIEKYLKDTFAAVKFVDMTHKTDSFEVYGDAAVETGTYVQTIQEKGKSPARVEGRYTIVFKNVNGQWLAHRDVSVPMPAAPGAPK